MSDAMTSTSSGPAPGMKICPYCAEEIREAAVKCRYCQSDLTEPSPTAQDAAPTPVGKSSDMLDNSDQDRAPVRTGVLRKRSEKPAKPEVPSSPQRTRFPALARPAVVIALSALVVVALVVNLLLLLGWHGYREQSDARSTGQVTAVNDIEKILSYDYRSFDSGTKAAEKVMTPHFRKKYGDTVDAVRADARPTQAVVKAQVVASSVVSAKKDKVKALLFVNQTTTRKNLSQPRVDLNRVEVTLVKSGDDWLVDNIQAL